MNRSLLAAAGLALAAVAWLASGALAPAPEGKAAPSATSATSAGAVSGDTTRGGPMRVAVATQEARPIERAIVVRGQVEPNREVTVRAETGGRIAEVVAVEGRPIEAGQAIVRLRMNDREARLARIEASVREHRRAYDAAKKLGQRGFETERRLDRAWAELQASEAELAQVQLDIENTTIRAPFDGVLEDRRVELGDYVGMGDEVATVVDNDPVIVAVQVAQQDIAGLAPGAGADVALMTGERRAGTMRYVGARADDATRTFRVEIELANPAGAIPSGVSAEARIPTGAIAGHFLSPAVLALSDAGALGVKTVDAANRIVFRPVSVVQAEADGVWVAGLPETARIVVVGQGFVREGDLVQPVPAAAQPPGGEPRPDLPPGPLAGPPATPFGGAATPAPSVR